MRSGGLVLVLRCQGCVLWATDSALVMSKPSDCSAVQGIGSRVSEAFCHGQGPWQSI